MMPKDKHSQHSKKTIFYDGSCPMCSAIIKKVDSNNSKRFETQNIVHDPIPHSLTKEGVEKEIHLIDTDGKIYKNAQAILKILEEYPRWRLLASVGRLPIVRRILPVGYNSIAANRHFVFGPASRIFWMKIILCFGFLVGFALSLKLWISERLYPLAPITDALPKIIFPIDYILFFFLIFLLLAIVVSSRPRMPMATFIALIIFISLFDQSRWQPWAYQYIFMITALALFSWKHDDVKGQNNALNILRLIMASIYFWSGLQKLNINFLFVIFPWMIQPAVDLLPEYLKIFPHFFGAVIPFIEMTVGLGLLSKKLRSTAVIGALTMHVFILFAIGPFGRNWNSVVWPWNITMILCVILLFWRTENSSFRNIIWVQKSVFQKTVLILFVIMPAFSLFNLWDSYLSSSLYTGNTNEAIIFMNNNTKNTLPYNIQKYMKKNSGDQSSLHLSEWSFGELHVPPYPEKRIHKNTARDICRYAGNSPDVTLAIHEEPKLFFHSSLTTYQCSDL